MEINDLKNAVIAYRAADHKESLNKIGDFYLKEAQLLKALEVYESAGNNEMVSFIRSNFA